ncbi:6-phosphogluconate dehydrogenase [Amphibacillus marinus]|uniref:6-phosphogluconate dehydrogenase, decarboxylating n=1 Tax=Amphibacillus marinus TaxID=872970 RepID=A0A1H8MCH9_9BACI|nr:decarboxylating NADP(+)-dependent phosphogluconate dehydrogenase [Amphibacillus marinus]SEO14970.1 6-phosphogluconate dehydrogenase [Amphibacillus marinus]
MKHSIGVIGLGVMGSNIALNMARKGERVAVYNYTSDLTNQLIGRVKDEQMTPFYQLADFVESLEVPRKIFLMVTAGDAVDSVIQALRPLLGKKDIIIDGGNSHFKDTANRYHNLKKDGIAFIGAGISGGEVGALEGPAIMPGGDREAYQLVAPILTRIAAQVDGEPCCTYLGIEGSGHFVKTVHNGIEYADMQLISEAYSLLRYRLKLSLEEIASLFDQWNAGELNSYLIEITATILRKKDAITGAPLIDVILDKVGQKGTGMWTSLQAIESGIPSSIMTESLFARYMSTLKEDRLKAAALLSGPDQDERKLDKQQWIEFIRQALYMGKICAYAQGFNQFKMTSEKYNWLLPLPKIARIFRGGCVIRASFLNDICKAYTENPGLENLLFSDFFLEKAKAYQQSLRFVVREAVGSGIALPCFLSSLSYYDSYRTAHSNANLLQAQRDFFGAHTYERNDRAGVFHTDWEVANADIYG